MKFLKTVLLLGGIAAATAAQARQDCAAQTVVYYGNGVGRGVQTYSDALDSRNKLNAALSEVLEQSAQDQFAFKLAFNQSRGTLTDIIEAARQTFGNEWPSLLMAFLLSNPRILDLIPSDIRNRFNDFLTNHSIQQMVAPDLANTDLAGQLESYGADIDEGRKVVLVSHSQGNIFGNLAFQRLSSTAQQYFTMVPVASPEPQARKMLAGHVRFADDLVILGVELARVQAGLSRPLGATDEDNVDAELTSHEFVRAYLADNSSREFIREAILRSADLLPEPPVIGQPGAITVRLTWGANPDVDLHAFEPTNRHVYYAAMQGDFGTLDVDDVSSFGPEHYVVSCQSLRENPNAIGRYRFGVNYYSGQTAETATVTIKTPSREQTFTRLLQQPRGAGGDQSPVPVADVVVMRNPANGRLEFVIESR